MTGHSISHSTKHSKRRWLPNLKSMKVNRNGSIVRLKVCTACVSANRVTKVV